MFFQKLVQLRFLCLGLNSESFPELKQKQFSHQTCTSGSFRKEGFHLWGQSNAGQRTELLKPLDANKVSARKTLLLKPRYGIQSRVNGVSRTCLWTYTPQANILNCQRSQPLRIQCQGTQSYSAIPTVPWGVP